MANIVSYIGLGSNQHDPAGQVQNACRALDALPGSRLLRCSSLYASAPVGEILDQPDFINAVCEVETALDARALLQHLLEIERRAGRLRGLERGGPRVLDLDLLIFGKALINEVDLVVPHPRLHQRAFVLYPLAELDEKIMIPGQGPVGDLMKNLSGQRIKRID